MGGRKSTRCVQWEMQKTAARISLAARSHVHLRTLPSPAMHRFLQVVVLCVLFLPIAVVAQDDVSMKSPVAPTPADERLSSVEQRQQLADESLVKNLPFENVGPTVMSGRVVDVDVNPADPTHFYVAYASGGLWRTTNNGRSFEPLFDREAVMTLGDIAVDWGNGQTIWVGTGENNSSRSSYAGAGIYKSTDGGAKWTHHGLAPIHRTGRIVLHPDDSNTVWVAAAGHLYSPNPERGVYKTTDGGDTWAKALYVDEHTGAIDLVIDTGNPDVLYAAMWQRARRAWNFEEAGAGSGIYKSTDGGMNWTRLNTADSGFPTGEGVGRIGLALAPGDEGALYAFLDNQNRRPVAEEDEEQPALARQDLEEMDRDAFLALDEADIADYLRRNDFPRRYTAASVLELVREGAIEPEALVNYLADANAQLFDTPVIGAEVYRSNDGGQTWTRTHEDYLDQVYYSYGYYFGEIRVAPHDPETIYIMGVPFLISEDGGATFHSVEAENVHVDHHALWVSPTRPGHLVNGNDGGVNMSYDNGETWFKANTPPVGQFYAVGVDDAEPYTVCGGLQDNGVWCGPHTYEQSYEWYAEGDYPYDRIMGGDGMQVEIDTRTNDIAYTGFQFGNYFRIDRSTGDGSAIQPQHDLGERPLRFNWMTPIHLSRHNQDILYLGSNKLHRSMDQGETWTDISDDLTRGDRAGNVPYGTLSTIDESPLQFGVLYTGSDDGLIHVSRDGGASWQRIDQELPQRFWVSRVEASNHVEGRVYTALNGYRWDHFTAYVFRSDDYGQTWQRIGTDLPAEPVNVVLEDPSNEDVVYVGTDHGLYVSLDRGDSFMALHKGLPNAPVHDLKVQARAADLIVGTHGRSIYRADLEALRQLTPDVLREPVVALDSVSVRYDDNWGDRSAPWRVPDVPTVDLPFYSNAAGETTIRVTTEEGLRLQTLTHDADRGLNYATYNLTVDPAQSEAFNTRQEGTPDEDEPSLLEPADDGNTYLVPGTYSITLQRGGASANMILTIEAGSSGYPAEPRMRPSGDEEIK